MADRVGVTPDVVIRDVHALALEYGFRKLRIDRSGYGGTDQRPACWIEVGYASGEIHVRTSDPQVFYRRETDKVHPDEIAQILEALIDTTEEPK